MNDLLQIEQELMQFVQKKVVVKVNQNKRVMLSILAKKKDALHLSMHHIFLKAPKEVTEAVAHFLQGKKEPFFDRKIKEYIALHLGPKPVLRNDLWTLGEVHDLQLLFDEVNREYFNQSLQLKISWFKTPIRKRRKSRTLGRFCSVEEIIWMNHFLDQPKIPSYFISFVIFHEIAHYFVGTAVDKNGRHRLHGSDFKEFEKKFVHYQIAKEWQKKNQKILLKG